MYFNIPEGETVIDPRDGEVRSSKFKTGSNPRIYSSSLIAIVRSTSTHSPSFTVIEALSARGQSLIGLTVILALEVAVNPSSSVTL